jgi:hypothetical protein
MWFRFLGWSLVGLSAAAAAVPHDGLKIVARETFPAGSGETTTYVAGDRIRVETRMSSHAPDGGTQHHEAVMVRRCDLDRELVLRPAERTYDARPLGLTLNRLERFAVSLGRRDQEPSSAARPLIVETTTVDTGERKMAFGHSARHVITTRRDIPPGSAGAAGETVTDGWYIDLETRPACERQQSGRTVLVGVVSSPNQPRASRPRVTFKDIGNPETGFAIETSTTWHTSAPDAHQQVHSIVTHTVVTEVSAQQLDARLFEVPEGYRSSDGMFTSLAARWGRTAQIVRSVVASWFG